MKFEKAFEQLREGYAIRISYWEDDMCIKAQYPDRNSKMTDPYLYLESEYITVPWIPSATDLFCEEWEAVVAD